MASDLAATSDRVVMDGRTASFRLWDGAHEMRITQGDVRAIQLAKAALYAGCRLLMDKMGIDKVDRIKLAGAFGLSRSTLLYYDRIGLLPPSGRTASGYRYYTDKDHQRLERICAYRQAGLTLEDIRAILFSRRKPLAKVLESRLQELGKEVRELKNKQRLLSGMLKNLTSSGGTATIDKRMWADMLRAAGMDEEAMCRWHAEFERNVPQGHHSFLRWLGIPEKEALAIRAAVGRPPDRAPRGRRTKKK